MGRIPLSCLHRACPVQASLSQRERVQILSGTERLSPAGVSSQTRSAGWRDCLPGQKRKFAVQEPAVSSGEPRLYAFDLLSCNGEDLRYFALAERKHRLRGAVAHEAERLLYCDHIEEGGETSIPAGM